MGLGADVTPLRIARFMVGLAIAVATEIHDLARRELLRRIDHLLHGAPCPCCLHDEEDCWADPSATPTKDTRR